MRRDGRALDHETLEEIRLTAVRRVRDGEKPAVVIAGYGFSRTTIYKWLKASSGRGKGLRALRATQASGRPRTLTAAQERHVFRLINGRDPRRHGLDFGLWTRAGVGMLIAQKFGMRLGVTAVGALLSKLGLTPHKPLQRACQRDPGPIERWQRESYPAIAAQARRERADVLFWDEADFRAGDGANESRVIPGHASMVRHPDPGRPMSAASAVNSRGAFWFSLYEGALNADLLVELLEQLMHKRKRAVHLVIENLPAHRKAIIEKYVESTDGRLSLHFLPGHAPAMTGDESVWGRIGRADDRSRAISGQQHP